MITYLMDQADESRACVITDRAFGVVLAALFILVYTQGFLARIGVPPNLLKLILEVPIFVILLHLINRGVPQQTPGFFLIALYVIWTIVSAIYHGDGIYGAVLYCRYVVYAYIIFAAVWVTPLTRDAVMRINTVIALLFILQITASGYEVFVRGERVEAHVGVLYADGGALATEFPLFAMALTVPFYLFWRANPLLLVLSWAFFFVGYASGKRAIYFLGPSLYFFIFGWYFLRTHSWHGFKRFLWATVIFVGLVPVLLLGVAQSAGIGRSNSKSLVDQTIHALTKAREYTFKENHGGGTEGRTATTRRVISALLDGDKGTVLFGRGPLAVMGGGGRYDALMIEYGITGWTRDVISIGLPGMGLYMLFLSYLFHLLWRSPRPTCSGYWSALRFSIEISFVVIMICYLGYSSSFATSGQLSYVCFYLLALLLSPHHRHLMCGQDLVCADLWGALSAKAPSKRV